MQELSAQRKQLIKPDSNGVFKLLCSSEHAVTKHLFGDDLTKKIKDIDEAQQVGNRVHKTTDGYHGYRNKEQFHPMHGRN